MGDAPGAALLVPTPPSPALLSAWLTRHHSLLSAEAAAASHASALLSTCASAALLASHGLALLSLSPASALRSGPGGTRLLDLSRPAHFHADERLPAHQLRPGDTVRCALPDASSTAKRKGGAKAKGKEEQGKKRQWECQAVVYRTSEKCLTLSLKGEEEEQWPPSVHVFKVADESVVKR